MSLWLFWFIFAAVLIGIEIFTFHFVTGIFAVGALGAGLTSLFIDNIAIQILIFIIISILTMVFARPFLKKFFKVNQTVRGTPMDEIIGKVGTVTKIITSQEFGSVNLEGQRWTAKSLRNETIDVNEKVKVVEIEGVKLIVEKYQEE